MQPVEQRYIELGERVMVDDVFRHSGKHPQSCEADYQPEREVQPQILAAREARGCKHLQVLGACDEARAISLEPAPPEHERHDKGDLALEGASAAALVKSFQT